MKKYLVLLFGVVSVTVVSGFLFSIPVYTHVNEPLVGPDGSVFRGNREVSRASLAISPDEVKNGAFIAVSISGGGSRAANFGAAVLSELDNLGILEHVSLISCTSGGCLPAAYYALHGQKTNWLVLTKLLREDFFANWLTRMFYPQNFLRNFFTDFDRSDVMASVFDDVLFKGARFGDLGSTGPKIAINATDVAGEKFVFSSEDFETQGSRIDRFPLSYAVMASGAFPLVFNSVTLANYRAERTEMNSGLTDKPGFYLHLFDGGSVDNLGIGTVLDSLDNAVASAKHSNKPPFKSCLVIAVDAYGGDAAWVPRAHERSDPRQGVDFLFDRNAVDATDAMLKHLRRNVIEKLRPNGDTIHKSPYWTHNLRVKMSGNPHENVHLPCDIWHISFERLETISGSPILSPLVRGIETHYKLTGLDCSPKLLQEALTEAARRLVRADPKGTARTCEWVNRAGFETDDCHVSYDVARTDWPVTGPIDKLKCRSELPALH